MAKFRNSGALEAKLREIAAKVRNPGTLRVGFLENATYPDGTSVAMVAAVQEFGSPAQGIPPRPFFRNMIAEKQASWGRAVAGVLRSTDMDATQALKQVGEGIKGQLQQSIINTNDPPLAPATIAAKSKGGTSAAKLGVDGPAKPLIDTGTMIKSVDWEITG